MLTLAFLLFTEITLDLNEPPGQIWPCCSPLLRDTALFPPSWLSPWSRCQLRLESHKTLWQPDLLLAYQNLCYTVITQTSGLHMHSITSFRGYIFCNVFQAWGRGFNCSLLAREWKDSSQPAPWLWSQSNPGYCNWRSRDVRSPKGEIKMWKRFYF